MKGNVIMDNLSFLENPKICGELSVLGVPLDLGKDASGTDASPEALRSEGLISILGELGFTVHDLKNIICPRREAATLGDLKIKYLKDILPVLSQTAEVVKREVLAKKKMLVIGGDNTISIGSVGGAADEAEPLGVIWIDAHADINTNDTTLSGNVHGMPIAALLGLGDKRLTNISFSGAKIKPENLLYIGLKDVDVAEMNFLRQLKVPTVTMLEIAESGLSPAFEKIKILAQRVKRAWVCLDVDSIDGQYAPATPMATSGGLTYRESINLAKFIGKICPVIGVDVSEFAPALDSNHRTAQLIIELVANYFGGEAGWYSRYMNEEIRKQSARKNSETGIDIASKNMIL